jgi:tetratricopeptide (TPR) repeat protein
MSLNPRPAATAESLRQHGYAAFRAGNPALARDLFTQSLTLFRAAHGDAAPQTATAWSDLGAAQAALGDHTSAESSHRAALRLRRAIQAPPQDIAASLHNLGACLAYLANQAEATDCHNEAAALWRQAFGPTHPAVARALSSLGRLARQQADTETALRLHEEALTIHQAQPEQNLATIAAALDDLATSLAAAGRPAEAAERWQAAGLILRARLGHASPALAPLLNNLGVARRTLRDFEGAHAAFTEAVAADPTLAAARHNLAALLSRLGRHQEARPHRDIALRRENLFIQPAPPPAPRVLILSASDTGNVPLDHLLPEATTTRLWWFVDHAAPNTPLPPYDLVFNGIGDADLAGPGAATVSAFLQRNTAPLLNHPAHIARTRRDLLPATLGPLDGLILPPTLRIDSPASAAALRATLEHANLALPLLLRPAGAHGGEGVLRIHQWPDLATAPLQSAPTWYATPFLDCRDPDGFVRKYRIVFIDRQPLPYHLAISPTWLVHYFSADMPPHPFKHAEEAAFLRDWRAVLGPRATAVVETLPSTIKLDYFGIDFTLSAAKDLILFEANATMLVHPEPDESVLAYKNPAVHIIIDAMRGMASNRMKGKKDLLF